MNPNRLPLAHGAVLSLFLLLAACGGSSGGYTPGGGGGASCVSPQAPEAIDQSVVVNVPSDFDATATPTPTATTTINFTIMLPRRCPGDHFPLVLQSHGYGGTRLKTLGPDGTLDPTQAHFPSINTLVQALPYHGYVVISYDERGHGTPAPGTAPHNARTIDPAAETQDAIALLDWAYDNADTYSIQRETGTGIAKDIRVATIGYSYGGGFEMPLALLDGRVDAMVPNGTWNNLLYSLLPGDAVKLGFDSLLCLLAEPDPTGQVGGNVNNTPLVATLCNLIGPQGSSAASLRTRSDLAGAATLPTATPRPARDEDELLNYCYSHGTRYFENQLRDGKALAAEDKPGYVSAALNAITGTPVSGGITIPDPAARRAIPVLFLQGNRDVLFNLTDAYFNYEYFKAAGGDVRLLTTEGGHMNPLAFQTEGTANCGGIVGVYAILAWLDEKLKGSGSAIYDAIPQVCISVTPTPAANTAPANASLTGVRLSDIPVGSLSGAGAVATTGDVAETTVTSSSSPVFVPIGSPIAVSNAVLAGIPRVASVIVNTVTGVAPPPGTPIPVAYVGVGLKRGTAAPVLVDDQVTAFAMLDPASGTTTDACASPPAAPAIEHCNNRGMGNGEVLLPGVGELLQSGDQLGLLFFDNQVQYLPANNAGTAAQTGLPNPYKVTVNGVELPVLVPGTYPGSSLSTP